MTELTVGLLTTLAFAGTGIIFLVIGFWTIDLITPGKLAQKIFVEHNLDASLVLGATQLSIGVVMATNIVTAPDDTWLALLETTAYGCVAVAALAISFVILDWVTPGRLGDLVTDDKHDPAVWVTVAMQLAVGLVVAASLT